MGQEDRAMCVGGRWHFKAVKNGIFNKMHFKNNTLATFVDENAPPSAYIFEHLVPSYQQFGEILG